MGQLIYLLLKNLFLDAWVWQPGRPYPVWLSVIGDLVSLALIAGVSFTFRLRTSNPYFMLEDTEAYIDNEAPGGTGSHGSTGPLSTTPGTAEVSGNTTLNPGFTIDSD